MPLNKTYRTGITSTAKLVVHSMSVSQQKKKQQQFIATQN